VSQGAANNIILTGLPRSGTTLCCRLLNGLPNVVALHEPMKVMRFSAKAGMDAALADIEDFYAAARWRIATEGFAPSKQVDGEVPDNHFTDRRNPDTGKRLRHDRLENERIRVRKPLDDSFALVIKQPAAFTALLEVLAPRFPTFAVVRSPLAVLGSWNSLDISVSDGHLPPAESLSPELAEVLAGIGDPIERQVFLLNWFFEQYERFLPRAAIIHYEHLVASGGAELARVVPAAGDLQQKLQNRNDSPLYDHEQKQDLLEALRAADGACWHFYSKDSGRPLENNQ